MSVAARGAHETGGRALWGGRPPPSWPPRELLDLHCKSSRSRSFKKSRSRMSGKLIHEHLWDRRTVPLLVRRGAEIARRADRGEAHEQFTQLRSSPER